MRSSSSVEGWGWGGCAGWGRGGVFFSTNRYWGKRLGWLGRFDGWRETELL